MEHFITYKYEIGKCRRINKYKQSILNLCNGKTYVNIRTEHVPLLNSIKKVLPQYLVVRKIQNKVKHIADRGCDDGSIENEGEKQRTAEIKFYFKF